MSIPENILLYRIIHVDNLRHILDIGKITAPNHPQKDDDYISIGNSTLIESRREREITLPPKGAFNDYVSFYFGPRSPMLYNIWKGFQGVKKRSQEDIIYLVSSYDKIKEIGCRYVYFDGHGYHNLSQIYSDDEGLKEIDWKAVKETNWQDTAENPDLKRRKQAELLVHSEAPLKAIIGIACYSEEVKRKIDNEIQRKNLKLVCKVRKKWYY